MITLEEKQKIISSLQEKKQKEMKKVIRITKLKPTTDITSTIYRAFRVVDICMKIKMLECNILEVKQQKIKKYGTNYRKRTA